MTETDDNTITIDESELDALVEQKVQERIDAAAAEQGRTRRSVLSSLAGLAGVGAMGYFGGQKVAAQDASDASGTVYFEQIGDSNNPVQDLYVQNQNTVDSNITVDTVTASTLVESENDVVVQDILKLDNDTTDDHSWFIQEGDSDDLMITQNETDIAYQFVELVRSAGTVDLGPGLQDIDLNIDSGQLTLGGQTALSDVVASGSATLSSGSAVVDTGVSSDTTSTYMVALGPTTDDAEVSADIRAASGGNYEVEIQETDTSVGNPTVEYDIVRVR